MSLDLVLRNARIVGSTADAPLQDVGITGGRIAAIEAGLPDGGESLDVDGGLVSGGLIETHIHLDKSRLLDRSEPAPDRGVDHMRRVSAVKPGFTVEDVYKRAGASLETAIAHGCTHMRTHVEVDPNVGLKSVDALEQLAKDYAWAVELQLCVFLQEGWTGVPEGDANLVATLERGATAIGGAPSYDSDGPGQINRIFELAKAYDVDVDIHLDVGANHDHLDIYQVCELADKLGWGGRVAVGYGSKYSSMPPDKLRDLGKLMSDSGVSLTMLPATDLFTVGRHQDHSVMRGVADGNALAAHGVNCCL
jgi:cytosine/creatinine deaminase